MKKKLLVIAALVVTAISSAHADSLLAARVVANDVQALAKFYQQAFGLQEVNRFASKDGVPFEIMLNFGETVEAAKANNSSSTQIVVTKHGEKEAPVDAVAHIVISVSDMAKSVASFKAAGGRFEKEPADASIGALAFTVGVGTDPAGNRVEIIHLPSRK
jgi:predicted enzyme related to lactoylglutathione lyase